MPSIWANFIHVFEVFQASFCLPLIAKRCARDKIGDKSNIKMNIGKYFWRESFLTDLPPALEVSGNLMQDFISN